MLGSIFALYVNVIVSPFLIDGIVYSKWLPLAVPVMETGWPVEDVADILEASRDKTPLSSVIVSFTTTFVLFPCDSMVTVYVTSSLLISTDADFDALTLLLESTSIFFSIVSENLIISASSSKLPSKDNSKYAVAESDSLLKFGSLVLKLTVRVPSLMLNVLCSIG